MKAYIIVCWLAASLLTGCASEKTGDFRPIEGRFGYVTHISGVVDRSLSSSLCYLGTNGNAIVVWPSLLIISGNNIVITNDTAVLVGGKAVMYKDGIERLTARLMGFKGPGGPPIDITDQVLMKYYIGKGMSLTNFMWDSFVSLTKTNDSIKILFGSRELRTGSKDVWDLVGSTAIISWHDVEAIMQDIKRNGKFKKDKLSGVEFMQKE